MSSDNPAIDGVINSFRALDQSARSDALLVLLRELTAQECKDVQRLVNARKSYCDIIGRVPFELVLTIFSFLDIAASYRLQTVCKRWHAILTSPKFLRDALAAWYDAPLSQFKNDHDHALHVKAAEHVQRLCSGRPYSFARKMMATAKRPSFLIDDTFCYVAPSLNQVCLLNLRTAKQVVVECPDGIEHVDASSEIVAFASWRACYARPISIDNGECKEFKVPGIGLPRSLTCSGRTVIFAYPKMSKIREVLVYVFDYDCGLGHSFSPHIVESFHSNPEYYWQLEVLVDSKSKTVTAICCERDSLGSANDMFLHFVTYNFAGDRICYKTATLPDIDYAINRIHVGDCEGQLAVSISVRNRQITPTQTFALIPSATEDKYFVGATLPNPMPSGIRYPVARWKDVVYKAVAELQELSILYPRKSVMPVTRKFEDICTSIAAETFGKGGRYHVVPEVLPPYGIPDPLGYFPANFRHADRIIHINENFLITGPHEEYYGFYSFDKDVDLTGFAQRVQMASPP